ncbi:sulfur carrier protein ThiS [Aquisalimonas asiatica]|uniref:ThiS family protein n=1 Tax=Aquisalimonas asiatica TaxID=406100 RepID=A0A1H8QR88_9GAMM|nr:MoaD/ThiS family protein [Aquisalimonas asiatica]SEO56374.1 ThiS family protein [Aquisalimonas asiatica]
MCSDQAADTVAAGQETIRLQIKLFASLHVYLPAGAERNEVTAEYPAGITPNALLAELGVPREMAHLVLRNGVYIKPGERDQPVLVDGDAFAVWPPVAGG